LHLARDHRQRAAPFRGGVRSAGGVAVRPDVYRLDAHLFRQGDLPAEAGAVRSVSVARVPDRSCWHETAFAAGGAGRGAATASFPDPEGVVTWPGSRYCRASPPRSATPAGTTRLRFLAGPEFSSIGIGIGKWKKSGCPSQSLKR